MMTTGFTPEQVGYIGSVSSSADLQQLRLLAA